MKKAFRNVANFGHKAVKYYETVDSNSDQF